jgi:hypothetical protein
MVTMDHAEAISKGAAERYALDEMDEPERDDYEEHFFDCPMCAEEVKAATRFLDAAKPIARENRLAEALERSGRARQAAAARFAWPGVKTLFWPMPLGAAAALALALGGPALYLATVKVPRLEHALAEADALQPAPWQFLSVSRGEPQIVKASGQTRVVGLTLSRSFATPHRYYRCELRDAAGRAVLSTIVPAPAGGDELQILLPVSRLRSGPHQLVVSGLESPSGPAAPEAATYAFTLEREETR